MNGLQRTLNVGLCWGASALVALAFVAPGAATEPVALDGPLSPEDALKAFALEPGLRVELVAAEPLVDSPVAMVFDERGRLFVAENRGYPNGPAAGEPPVGRISVLEDTDGDGRFEKRTTFADELTFPNGVMPYDGWLIVTCAPDILFLRDTDGDGRADERRVWFTGFSTKGSTQLRVSHPTLSLDGWIYVTSGLTGGEVTCPAHAERPPLKFGRTDFRFRPDRSAYETCDGGGQFGLCFDDFGHRFICYNRVQVQHVVLPSKYLRRNPHLAFSETVQDCPADLAPEPLAGHGRAARLFPISANVTTADSHGGTFTAACSVFVWRGNSLPPEYRGGAFSCDPTGNLVHFDRLTPRGATFEARATHDCKEFLASSDNWCRPVFLAAGPDGALYICDMYRKTIEHPDYLPAEIRKQTDFDSGRGMGRIWRVVSDTLDAKQLAQRRQQPAAPTNDDGWHRDTWWRTRLAARDRQRNQGGSSGDRTRIDLSALIHPAPVPVGAHDAAVAVTLLRSTEEADLPDETLMACLRHPAAAVRGQALLVAEPRLARSPALVAAVMPLANDADPRVRFQWALTVGTVKDQRPIAALAELAIHDAADRWLRAAVLSSIAGQEETFLQELLSKTDAHGEGVTSLCSEVGRMLGAGQPDANWAKLVGQMLSANTSADSRDSLLAGFAEALRSRGANPNGGSGLYAALRGDISEIRATRDKLDALIQSALRTASDPACKIEHRLVALALLTHAEYAAVGEQLLALVEPAQPAEVQARAIRALAGMQDERIAAALLSAERFPSYSPVLREEVLSAMLSGKQHLPGLMAAIESGTVPSGAIDSLRRRQLTEHADQPLRQRALRAFGTAQGTDRGKVYEDYKSVLTLAADSETGRGVFKKHCANCHRLDRDGFAVGPDLFGVRNQPKEALLLHILIPEFEITRGFSAYVVETKDGRTLTGLVVSDTENSLTLRQALGKEDTVLREDIERLESSKLSLMPQEIEKAMTRQDLADLLSYLKGENVRDPLRN
jgi:putative membrane-bound dehydrogenase-like protein